MLRGSRPALWHVLTARSRLARASARHCQAQAHTHSALRVPVAVPVSLRFCALWALGGRGTGSRAPGEELVYLSFRSVPHPAPTRAEPEGGAAQPGCRGQVPGERSPGRWELRACARCGLMLSPVARWRLDYSTAGLFYNGRLAGSARRWVSWHSRLLPRSGQRLLLRTCLWT